jgi:hypothetical protein
VTSALRPWLVLCLALAAGEAVAEPATAIIWRGNARTPEAAAQALE